MTYHLRAFLGADDATLTRALTDGGPIEAVLGAIPGRLSGPARTALAAEITAAAGGLLEDDLGSVLLSALMGRHGLVAAARETAAEPDVTRLVTLDDHVIRATDEPHVDVLVDHARVYVVRLVLTVALTVRGTRRCCSGSAWGSRCRRPSSRIRPAASPASPSPGSERRAGDGSAGDRAAAGDRGGLPGRPRTALGAALEELVDVLRVDARERAGRQGRQQV